MKIAILNNSGNVGKTTIAREVLGTNMNNVLVEVETHNSGNSGYEKVFKEYVKIDADEITTLHAKMIENEDIVVDIGASNILEFFNKMLEFTGLEESFDIFIVPTTGDIKQIKDTLKTVNILKNFGIDTNKIVVIANRVNPTTFEKDFEILLNASKKLGFRFNKDLAIRETKLLKELELLNKTLAEIVEDETDYRAKIVETKGTQEQAKWVKLDLAKMSGKKVYEDFKRVFQNIVNIAKGA